MHTQLFKSLLLALVILFSACESQVTKKCESFKMNVPEGWLEEQNGNPDIAYELSAPNAEAQLRVVKTDASQMTFDEFRQDFRSNVTTRQGKIIQDKEFLAIDEMKAEKIIFSIQKDNKSEAKKILSFIIYNGNESYFIFGLMLEKDFDKYAEVIDKTVKSWQCKGI